MRPIKELDFEGGDCTIGVIPHSGQTVVYTLIDREEEGVELHTCTLRWRGMSESRTLYADAETAEQAAKDNFRRRQLMRVVA